MAAGAGNGSRKLTGAAVRAAGVLALTMAIGLAWGGAAGPQLQAQAQTAPLTGGPQEAAVSADSVLQTLRIGELLGIMREEGVAYGASLEGELFPGRGGADWQRALASIYDARVMQARFSAAFKAAIDGDEATLAAADRFFGAARGQRILELEIEARRALLDDGAEEAAKVRFADMQAAGDPRVALLEAFVAAGDFVEANVQGAMNANLAFWRGLAAAGGQLADTPEEDMLADVWGQEPEVRQQTTEWLFAYLALAYGPLPDADLEAYIAFTGSAEGRRLNIALFAAFDAVFEQVSHDLGRAAGRQMMGQDI